MRIQKPAPGLESRLQPAAYPRRQRTCELPTSYRLKPGLQTLICLTALLFGPVGCTVGPDYRRPAAACTNTLPSAFASTASTIAPQWKAAKPSAHFPGGVVRT